MEKITLQSSTYFLIALIFIVSACQRADNDGIANYISFVRDDFQTASKDGGYLSSILPPGRRWPIPVTIGESLGIQVQPWYLKESDLLKIRASGFRVVRWGFTWEQVEEVKGTYNWTDIDRFVNALDEVKLSSVIILGFGNRLYGPTIKISNDPVARDSIVPTPPSTSTARSAFANFAAAAASRYQGKSIIWEIWNEPDSSTFWPPQPDIKSYGNLAYVTCNAIKTVDPSAKVVAAAGAAMPNAVSHQSSNLYRAVVENRAMDCLDGVSGHSYRMTGFYDEPDPESIWPDNLASQAYLYATLKVPETKILITTEWGFSSAKISANLQAAYLIRGALMNAASGVPLTVWYEWRDSRSDSGNPESHFGLNELAGEAKNTVHAFDLLNQIGKSTIIKMLPTGKPGAIAMLLNKEGKFYVVSWLRTDDELTKARLYLNGEFSSLISFVPTIVEATSDVSVSIK